jgi:type II secretory pathway component PulJ
MNKKLLKKDLEENIKMHASLQNHSEYETIIAVS